MNLQTAARPWLSVIIPTYNGEKFLPAALDSVVLQESSGIECIAVDDGSTDETLSILNHYRQKLPMRILRRKRRGNWVANTNYALALARGKYVCFLHQDDVWLSGRLKKMKGLIEERPDIILFLHPSYYLDIVGNYLGVWQCPLTPYPETIKPEIMVEKLLIQNFIAIPAPIFRRDVSQIVGGLDESAWYTADWDFWLKIARHGEAAYHPTPLSGFRIHSTSQTVTRSSYSHDFRRQLETVFRKHFDLWESTIDRKRQICKIATFSIEVNVTLAGFIHKNKSRLLNLIVEFILLGPTGWRLYIENSRIWERVTSRLKAQVATHSPQTVGGQSSDSRSAK